MGEQNRYRSEAVTRSAAGWDGAIGKDRQGKERACIECGRVAGTEAGKVPVIGTGDGVSGA